MNTGMRAGACAAAALLALATSGCATLALVFGLPRLAGCPGPIVSTDALPPGEFLLRDRLRIAGAGVDVGFELVSERRADRLVILGFNAFGVKAFAVTQRGVDVESRSFLGRALQVAPENVLRDVHAARLLEPDAPARVEVARRGCGYTATFVTVERRDLGSVDPSGLSASPSR